MYHPEIEINSFLKPDCDQKLSLFRQGHNIKKALQKVIYFL